jgi:hypothetical protein
MPIPCVVFALLASLSAEPPSSAKALQIGGSYAVTTLGDDVLVGFPAGLDVLLRKGRLWGLAGASWQRADNRGATDTRPLDAEIFRARFGAGWSLLQMGILDIRLDVTTSWSRTEIVHAQWSGQIPGLSFPETRSTRNDAAVGMGAAVRLAPPTGGASLELVPLACEAGSLIACSGGVALGWVF